MEFLLERNVVAANLKNSNVSVAKFNVCFLFTSKEGKMESL